MDQKSLDFSLKVRITLPDGRRQKFAISFPEMKLVRLNQATTGLDVGAVIEFLPGVTICRPAAGHTMTVDGTATDRVPIVVGSHVKVGYYEIEFLVLPDPLPEEEATRVVSLRPDEAANQERTQFVSLRDLNLNENKGAEKTPQPPPLPRSETRPETKPEARKDSKSGLELDTRPETKPEASFGPRPEVPPYPQAPAVQPQAHHPESNHSYADDATAIVRRMPLPGDARHVDERKSSSSHRKSSSSHHKSSSGHGKSDSHSGENHDELLDSRPWYKNLRSQPMPLIIGGLVVVTVLLLGRGLMHRSDNTESTESTSEREIASTKESEPAEQVPAANPPTEPQVQANAPYVPPPSGRGVPFQPGAQPAGQPPAPPAQPAQVAAPANPPPPAGGFAQANNAPPPPSGQPSSYPKEAMAHDAPSDSIYSSGQGQFDPMSVDFFFSAIERGDTFKIRELLDSRAVDVNLTIRRGYSPLHVAAARGDATTVKVLMKYKANPNARDPAGSTPLMWAVYRRHSAVVKLLAPITDLSLEREGGQKALDLAKSINAKEYYKMLEPKKIERKTASQKDKSGKSSRKDRSN